jgi:uncharacterized membrane protein YjgN (DUF898 family)
LSTSLPVPGIASANARPVNAAPHATAAPPGVDKHHVTFTGSGGDYFKLWLSNLLLTIVTLGIYTPWARRRRVQYFFRNTEVGPDPFDFTASSRSMVTSFILVALVYLLIQVMSSQGLSTAVSGITLLIAAATPWLWRSAVRFRMGNTTWRGLPFVFHATAREAYMAAWPLLGGAALIAVLALALPHVLPGAPATGAIKADAPGPMVWLGGLGVMVLAGMILIRLRFNFLQLQMARTSLGGKMSKFKADFAEFFKVGVTCIGIGLLVYAALAGMIGLFSAGLIGFGRGMSGGGIVVLVIIMLLFLIPLLLVPASITMAAWEAMVFRTVWSNAGLSNMARSKCNLNTRAFVWLRAKNVLLTLVTLGLYRPFAAVNEYRMKVDSVRIFTRGDINVLATQLERNHKNGLGDAAADLAGFDLAV